MPKHRVPVAVLIEREVYELYLTLREGDEFGRVIDKGLDILKEDLFAGERIKREQIPRYYVDKARRCSYTVIADEEGIKVVVLEVFPDHKSYAKRFGYKTS